MNYKERRAAFCLAYKGFRVSLPEGRDRLWEVRRSEMNKKSAIIATTMGMVLRDDRHALPGTYTLLVKWGDANGNPETETIVMSDHLCEVADHADLVLYAKTHAPLNSVLINGLGLGVAIELLEPYVEHFDIVELNPAVIRLVEPHYKARLGDRLRVIQHDALTYCPPAGTRYDAVFHDIWSFISHKNLPDMRLLHRRYGRFTDWQESWARRYCEAQAKKRAKNPEGYRHEVDTNKVVESLAWLFREVQP